MIKKSSIITALFGAVILFATCTQRTGPATPEDVGLSSDTLKIAVQKMQEFVDSSKLAGIATLIVKNGTLVHRERYGFADIENQKPIEEGTIFRIFSMTKPITAVALMILFDEGKFKLDDKVADYIPEFKETQVYTPVEDGFEFEAQNEEMTIRHLLTHTSGLTYGWDQKSYVDSLYRVYGASRWDSSTIGEKVKLLAGLPLKYQPGTRYEYSLSIDVAGYLVEVLSGIPLDIYFKTKIFEPLEMDDTGFFVPEGKHERLAELYFRDEEGKLHAASAYGDRFKKPVAVFSGGGGLVSTMDDYLNFCSMLLNGGELNGVRILQESTVKLIMSDQMPEEARYRDHLGYGLAGSVNLKSGVYAWAGAASTNFWIDPENEMIIIAYTQLMPGDHSYAYQFKDLAMRSMISDVKSKYK